MKERILTAFYTGDAQAIVNALNSGFGINERLTPDGDTLLTKSIFLGADISFVQYLLKRGADPDRGLINGRTPLMTAAGTGDMAVAELLLAHGASINKQMHNGTTALMYAVAKGHIDVARLLIKRGASMDLRDSDGWTVYDYARRKNIDLSQCEPSLVTKKVGDRYNPILQHFKIVPFGSNPHDLTVLSVLPPIDRVLILESLFSSRSGDVITLIDKLSMAYFKAGYSNLAYDFLRACDRKRLFTHPFYGYDFFVDKLSGLHVTNVSVRYEDALRALIQYDDGGSFCRLIRLLCERYAGREVVIGNFSSIDLQAFVDERKEFIASI